MTSDSSGPMVGSNSPAVIPIDGAVRNYDWGSRTALAELTGRPLPTAHPEAEMWFGAHPAAPSTVAGTERTLLDVIAGDPLQQLGADRPSDRLSFLIKLLAADQALSLQAHPTKEQAEEGFEREESEGIPRTASQRNYKDDNHKPELLIALTPFEALTGFRPLYRSQELLAELSVPELERTTALLGSGEDSEDLRALVTTWLTLPTPTKTDLVAAVSRRCRDAKDAEGTPEWMRGPIRVALELAEQYPGDSGVLISLLLNHVVLEPGEAVFLDAGKLHAYLCGTGVEIMANSDNVLRGGLTTKHVDVPELMRVMDFTPVPDPVCPRDDEGWFAVPVDDFSLREVDEGRIAPVVGPAVVLVAAGGAELSGEAMNQGSPVSVRPGQAMWVSAGAGEVGVTSLGRTFIATTGR